MIAKNGFLKNINFSQSWLIQFNSIIFRHSTSLFQTKSETTTKSRVGYRRHEAYPKKEMKENKDWTDMRIHDAKLQLFVEQFFEQFPRSDPSNGKW